MSEIRVEAADGRVDAGGSWTLERILISQSQHSSLDPVCVHLKRHALDDLSTELYWVHLRLHTPRLPTRGALDRLMLMIVGAS